MIAIDELTATLNRIALLQNNTESIEEEIMSNVIIQNLGPMIAQLEKMSGSPQFKAQVEMETERRKNATGDEEEPGTEN